MADLPGTDDGVSQWCKDIFIAKDGLLDKYFSEGTFGDQERHLGRPLKSLLVVLSWSSLLLYGAFRFFKWSALLSTWKGVVIFTAALLLVVVVMHIFIVFSQSERSSTARAARNRTKKD